MTNSQTVLALDVGGARIGVARGDTVVKLASPLTTLEVDGTEYQKLKEIVQQEAAGLIVIGYPRNQSGQPTDQTRVVERFVEPIKNFGLPMVFQDESLTSVLAEEHLKARRKPYSKADIDAEAAALILQDYLEMTYGH